MLENIKAVIFDIDGTLADSMGVWSESDRILLGRRGIPYTEEVSFALKSMHFMSAVTYLKNLYSLPDSEESIAEEITDIVRDKYFHEVKLMPFVPEMIVHFKERGIKMCAATSNSRELAEGVLGHNGILDELEFIITSDEAGSSKEDPKIFHMCAERLGTAPDETAVFEDSPHAAKTAFENGFYTVGVNSGHFGDFDALADCTDIRINSFKDLC
jgi:HAD hydrolase, family IA, variant 3